jgi:hypothetical protein
MVYSVFDIETNGLIEEVTKIHCLVYVTYDGLVKIGHGKLTNMGDIITFLTNPTMIYVGHNIIRYDIPVAEKVLGIKVTGRLIDTLPLSWYLYPNKIKHGLEYWGETFGVPKPVIVDWKNLTISEYVHRCTEDVKINTLLFHKQLEYLGVLYEYNNSQIYNLVNYLCYKLDCAREQEEVKCKLDRELVERSLEELGVLKTEKIDALVEAMPKNIKYKDVKTPKKPFKQDGTLSAIGDKWFKLLEEHNLPQDYSEEVKVKILEEDGNPASSAQIKDWLYLLGWEPVNFEYRKNKAGNINKIPQIYANDEVCPSIRELYEIEPALDNLDMLSLINHRIGIFDSYTSKMDSLDYVKAEISGLTNTLRFKHRKPIVNLPKISKFYGEQIRGAIITPSSDFRLCGSDMSSLEDTTKQHYMYYFDAEYVMQMRVPGFDPHIDIGVLARMLTQEQSDFFKWYNKTKKEIDKGTSQHVFTDEEKGRYYDISFIRGKAKTVNFAGVYGAGPPKIALTTGMPLEQAKNLHKTYWDRNKAVKQVAKACITKSVTVDGEDQMWLYNPVSKFWYTLRFEKDRFSTLNQGTGVYCFDLWVREVRKSGIKIMLQYHDEIAFPLKVNEERATEEKLRNAIAEVNKKVKLNVPLGVSVDFGNNYSEIH